MFLLDTDTVIYALKGHKIVNWTEELPPQEACSTPQN